MNILLSSSGTNGFKKSNLKFKCISAFSFFAQNILPLKCYHYNCVSSS